MNDIILNNICKSFGDKTVLDGLSAAFPKGRNTCIMGPSGCGKTTLLIIIAGLLNPDSGEIINRPDEISFVFQEDRLCEEFSAVSNVKIAAEKHFDLQEISALLERLGIENPKGRVSDFSGGMKRRVAIARALYAPFDLLLMDEPFKGLDGESRDNTAQIIKDYTEGRTVIFVSHDADDAGLLDADILDFSDING